MLALLPPERQLAYAAQNLFKRSGVREAVVVECRLSDVSVDKASLSVLFMRPDDVLLLLLLLLLLVDVECINVLRIFDIADLGEYSRVGE